MRAVARKRPDVMGRLSRLSDRRFALVVYAVTILLYVFGVWLHSPNGGGHIYSDLVGVFQARECIKTCDHIPIPYIQTFVEYPVLVAMFMYTMGILGGLVPGGILLNYYLFTATFLAIPTLLLVRELLILMKMRDVPRRRILWYFLITPAFAYVLLVNWYVIGVFFAMIGIRRYLQGSWTSSGVLFGLSAASNLVTAVPALGLFIASRTMKERIRFVAPAVFTYAVVNAPFLILNPKLWFQAYNYVYGWYTEDSWILAVAHNNYSPLRHVIPPIVFAVFVGAMVWCRLRRGRSGDPLPFAFVAMFAYVFSSYIYTPQENLALLPFFVLLPVANIYWEFLAFDTANAMIIILGFSQALLVPFGITYHFPAFGTFTLIWWIEVIRSLWVGKFALFNGISAMVARTPFWKRDGGEGGEVDRVSPSPLVRRARTGARERNAARHRRGPYESPSDG